MMLPLLGDASALRPTPSTLAQGAVCDGHCFRRRLADGSPLLSALLASLFLQSLGFVIFPLLCTYLIRRRIDSNIATQRDWPPTLFVRLDNADL